MAAAKFPNQNTIIIKKTPCKDNFLQINIDEWQDAAMRFDRNFNAFKIYLYLASNSIDYQLGLSPQAIENSLGIKKSSYYICINLLKELGYLVDIGGNRYEFYTSPKKINYNDSIGVENSTRMEKYMNDNDSTRMENSTPVEKVEKNPLSVTVENSIGMEKVDKNQDSTSVENSIGVENKASLFDF